MKKILVPLIVLLLCLFAIPVFSDNKNGDLTLEQIGKLLDKLGSSYEVNLLASDDGVALIVPRSIADRVAEKVRGTEHEYKITDFKLDRSVKCGPNSEYDLTACEVFARNNALTTSQIEKIVDKLGGPDMVQQILDGSVIATVIRKEAAGQIIVAQKEVAAFRYTAVGVTGEGKILFAPLVVPRVEKEKTSFHSTSISIGYIEMSAANLKRVYGTPKDYRIKNKAILGIALKSTGFGAKERCWIVSFLEKPTFDEVAVEMDKLGFRPATLIEGLVFGITNPKWPLNTPVVLLGEPAGGCFPLLCQEEGKPALDLLPEEDIGSKVYFLAIEK